MFIHNWAEQIVDLAAVWHEDSRNWLTYDQFLGFQIGRFVERYNLTGEQVQQLVQAVYSLL